MPHREGATVGGGRWFLRGRKIRRRFSLRPSARGCVCNSAPTVAKFFGTVSARSFFPRGEAPEECCSDFAQAVSRTSVGYGCRRHRPCLRFRRWTQRLFLSRSGARSFSIPTELAEPQAGSVIAFR